MDTGEFGTSWDTISEIVQLALNSEWPGPKVDFEKTSVGASTMAAFREEVRIMHNDRWRSHSSFFIQSWPAHRISIDHRVWQR